MFDRTIAFGVRRRIGVIAGIVIVTVGLGIRATSLRVDNSLEAWFVENDPTLRSYEDFLEEFGSDEVVVIAIRGSSGALQPERLERLALLTDRIGQIDGVDRVASFTSLAPGAASDPRLARMAVAQDGMASRLVGREGESLALVAWMDPAGNVDTERPRVLEEIRAATDQAMVPGERAHFGGVGVLHDALNHATIGEGGLFIGLSYLVITIALLLITRRLAWTAIALVVVTIADCALIGTMALLGRPINMITVALPPVVMILGVANVVHMSTELDLALARGVRSLDGLRRALTDVTVPCAFNALTTGVAFLSLATASMAVTRDYGIFAAVGVGFAFLYSVGIMAAILPAATRLKPPARSTGWLARTAELAMTASFRRPWRVLALTAVIVALCVVGASRIVVDTYSIGFLPEDHVVRQDDRILEDTLGPYLPLELEIRTEADDWRSHEFIGAVTAAQAAVERAPEIGRSTTVADVLRDVRMTVTGEATARPWSPARDADVRDAESWLRMSGHGDALGQFVADDQRTLRLTATTRGMSMRNFVATAERARASAQEVLGDQARVENSGYLPLYAQMIQHVVHDQITSFAMAFALVFLVVSLALRSWRFALVAIPPNLLPIGVVLGVMGFAGINLDIATVTVAAVVLGVIVDDTVHILHRLRRELAIDGDVESALRRVARASGLAVISTSLVFAAGFLVISLAASDAIAHSGLLMATAVVAALLTDLLLLPAFVALTFGRARVA